MSESQTKISFPSHEAESERQGKIVFEGVTQTGTRASYLKAKKVESIYEIENHSYYEEGSFLLATLFIVLPFDRAFVCFYFLRLCFAATHRALGNRGA